MGKLVQQHFIKLIILKVVPYPMSSISMVKKLIYTNTDKSMFCHTQIAKLWSCVPCDGYVNPYLNILYKCYSPHIMNSALL